MNIATMDIVLPDNSSPEMVGLAAATLIGGPLAGINRLVAGVTSYYTMIETKDSIEGVSDSFVSFLEDRNYLSVFGEENKVAVEYVAQIVTFVALSSLTLLATMSIVSFIGSYASPIAPFSPMGATATLVLSIAAQFFYDNFGEVVGAINHGLHRTVTKPTGSWDIRGDLIENTQENTIGFIDKDGDFKEVFTLGSSISCLSRDFNVMHGEQLYYITEDRKVVLVGKISE